MKGFRYIENAITRKLDEQTCIGCGNCHSVCPHRIFKIVNQKAVIIDLDACMECGACEINCSPQALRVKQGVGCAAAVISGFFKGTEPNCDCGHHNESLKHFFFDCTTFTQARQQMRSSIPDIFERNVNTYLYGCDNINEKLNQELLVAVTTFIANCGRFS